MLSVNKAQRVSQEGLRAMALPLLGWVQQTLSQKKAQIALFFVQVCAKSLQSYLTLCDPMDHSPPGSSVHGILKAGILEWVVMPSRMSPALAGGFFTTDTTWEAQ